MPSFSSTKASHAIATPPIYLGKQYILTSCCILPENATLSPRKLLSSFCSKPKWVGEACTSNHMGMGLSLKAGVGTPSCEMENLIFHFHGIQGFTRNTVCTPHSTYVGALFPFSWLLSLARKPRNLLAQNCCMLPI